MTINLIIEMNPNQFMRDSTISKSNNKPLNPIYSINHNKNLFMNINHKFKGNLKIW